MARLGGELARIPAERLLVETDDRSLGAEGAHVPRMQVRRGRAQQRRTVHGCQEGQGFASLEVVS